MIGLDLKREFDRTGLPRTALAAFLGLDNALISRLSDGSRSWKRDEYKWARAFFELVPTGLGPLVKRLRRRETRLLIGPPLVNALIGRGHRTAFGVSFRAVSEGVAELRADQIVALCRKYDFDLAHLMTGRGVKKGAWSEEISTLVNYEEACRGKTKVQKIGVARPGHRLPNGQAVRFVGRERLAERIAACQPFTVTDDELEPRYRRGETIYIDGSGRECRYGDDVVISQADGPAVIGMLFAIDSDAVRIETPKRGRVLVPSSEIVAMRRISFTER